MSKLWIDVHGHFSPPTTVEQREKSWHAIRAEKFMAPCPWHWTPESTLEYLDRTTINMQMLSYIPKNVPDLQASNNYAASLVNKHPTRFGLLAALPTDNPEAALKELKRANEELNADGYAVTCFYNGIYLSDSRLEPLWVELNRLEATVFTHPDAWQPAHLGRPSPLIEVAFETTRTIVDMLYAGIFRRYPNINFIISHCGGALPALSSRLKLLGAEEWVPNPHNITQEEIDTQLKGLYLDTAATAPSGLAPALMMTTPDHIVYGADCGVPCSSESTIERNKQAVLTYGGFVGEQAEAVGSNVLKLFPRAAARLGSRA